MLKVGAWTVVGVLILVMAGAVGWVVFGAKTVIGASRSDVFPAAGSVEVMLGGISRLELILSTAGFPASRAQ
jgi:hypothetical protein